MANRPKGYGMTADLAKKQAGKYDLALEQTAREWMEAVTNEPMVQKAESYDPDFEQQARVWMEAVVGEPLVSGVDAGKPLGMDAFADALKDGTYLCKLINIIKPGSVSKVNSSKMAFKMMENIGLFLTACENYGVAKLDMFQTVDLYEKQNVLQVVNGIHALGRKAQVKGFTGPTLGPKESQENKREFTEEQMREGQNVIGLQMGSNKGATQAGMNFGKGRFIVD